MAMSKRMALAALLALALAGCHLPSGSEGDPDAAGPPETTTQTTGQSNAGPRVEIVAPKPPGGEAVGSPGTASDPEACQTGCSLAKHDIPPFRRGDFEKALRAYARDPATAPGEALEKLLFYGKETRSYIARHGTGALPAEHLAFLTRELRRRHAIVEIRMIDESGQVRVAYGPQRVPLGQKEHLQPKVRDLQPLEINGTVMRTGLYHLWSRY